MPASLEFHSVTPYPVGDCTRLDLIRKELQAMSKRQVGLHIMDSDPYMEACIDDLIERLDEYLDYDPTPNEPGEPPLSAAEMHHAAWEQHRALHS